MRFSSGRPCRGAVTAWTAATAFREVVPNLIVIERMSAATTLEAGWSRRSVEGRAEEQRLLGVSFLRALPAANDSTR